MSPVRLNKEIERYMYKHLFNPFFLKEKRDFLKGDKNEKENRIT